MFELHRVDDMRIASVSAARWRTSNELLLEYRKLILTLACVPYGEMPWMKVLMISHSKPKNITALDDNHLCRSPKNRKC